MMTGRLSGPARVGGLGLAIVALACPAFAQAPKKDPALSELSLEELLTIEVQPVFGASRYLQRITEAPASVTIVTADEIARYGYRTISDALRMVRGMYVSGDRQYGFLGVRGFQRPGDYNTHVLMLVDGHRANDNVYDQGYIGEAGLVAIDDVDRIEVIRGPSSSMYGSNAFFAVVNVVTRRGARTGAGEVGAEVGSFGRQALRAAWRGPVGASGLFTVSATGSRSDGPSDLYFPEFDRPESSGGVAHDLDFARRGNVRASLDVAGFSLQAGWNRRRKGVPTAAYGIVFNDPRSEVSDRWGFVDAAWERAWGPRFGLNVRGFYDDYRYVGVMPFDYGPAGSPDVVENRDDSLGRWWGAEARASGRWRAHRWTAGFEYRQNDQRQRNFDVEPSADYLDDHRRAGVGGLYAQDDIRLSSSLSASIGLRRDTYEGFHDPTKPRLALIFTPTRTRTFKALYGEAFRAPTVYETSYAYAPYKANPSLEPEEIRTVELAWEEYVGRHVRVGANVFHYSVRNLISQVTDPTDGQLFYDNTDSAQAHGVEVEAEAKWAAGTQVRASYA